MVKGEIIFFKRFSNFNFRKKKKKKRWKKEKKGKKRRKNPIYF